MGLKLLQSKGSFYLFRIRVIMASDKEGEVFPSPVPHKYLGVIVLVPQSTPCKTRL